jgi:hypothetical protein
LHIDSSWLSLCHAINDALDGRIGEHWLGKHQGYVRMRCLKKDVIRFQARGVHLDLTVPQILGIAQAAEHFFTEAARLCPRFERDWLDGRAVVDEIQRRAAGRAGLTPVANAARSSRSIEDDLELRQGRVALLLDRRHFPACRHAEGVRDNR